LAVKAKVDVVKRSIRIQELLNLACNIVVVARLTATFTLQVASEVSETGVELLEDDGLCFNFADLLCDDPEVTPKSATNHREDRV
jgi:hypothetical protein